MLWAFDRIKLSSNFPEQFENFNKSSNLCSLICEVDICKIKRQLQGRTPLKLKPAKHQKLQQNQTGKSISINFKPELEDILWKYLT